MVCLTCQTLTFLLSLSIIIQVLADAGADPDPAFDKWDFGKKLEFTGANFSKNRFHSTEVQVGENLIQTDNVIKVANTKEESEQRVPKSHSNGFPNLDEKQNHEVPQPHDHPVSFNEPKKIDSDSYESFVKTMFSSTTSITTVPTATTSMKPSTISASSVTSTQTSISPEGSSDVFKSTPVPSDMTSTLTIGTTTITASETSVPSTVSSIEATKVPSTTISSIDVSSTNLVPSTTTQVQIPDSTSTSAKTLAMSDTTTNTVSFTKLPKASTITASETTPGPTSTNTNSVDMTSTKALGTPTSTASLTSVPTAVFSIETTNLLTDVSSSATLVPSTTIQVPTTDKISTSDKTSEVSDTTTTSVPSTKVPSPTTDKISTPDKTSDVSDTTTTSVPSTKVPSPTTDKISTSDKTSEVSDTTTTSVPSTKVSSSTTDKISTSEIFLEVSDTTTTSVPSSKITSLTTDKISTSDKTSEVSDTTTTSVPSTKVSSPTTDTISTSDKTSEVSDTTTTSVPSTKVPSPTTDKISTSDKTSEVSDTTTTSVPSTKVTSPTTDKISTSDKTLEVSDTTTTSVPSTKVPSTSTTASETTIASSMTSTNVVLADTATITEAATLTNVPSTTSTFTVSPATVVRGKFLQEETYDETFTKSELTKTVDKNIIISSTPRREEDTLTSEMTKSTIELTLSSETPIKPTSTMEDEYNSTDDISSQDQSEVEDTTVNAKDGSEYSDMNVAEVEDINGLLKNDNIIEEDFTAFLPPGFVTKSKLSNLEVKESNKYEYKDEYNIEDIKNTEVKESNPIEKDYIIKEDVISALLPPGFVTTKSTLSNVKDVNIIEDDISALLPPGFVTKSKFSNLSNRYKSLQRKTSKSQGRVEDVKNELKVDLSKFGKVATTTVDPISEILANVVIIDVTDYLPKGYEFRQDETEEEEVVENLENINDLLIQKEEESKMKFKPGKLNGKKLAAISNELKEAELYYSTFSVNIDREIELEKRPGLSPESKKTFVSREPKQDQNEERNGKKISDASLEFSAASIFAAILGGEDIEIDKSEKEIEYEKKSELTPKPKKTYGWREPKHEQISDSSLEVSAESIFASILGGEEINIDSATEHVDPASPSTSATSTTTRRSTTALTPMLTTPGVCGDFCSLAGTIFIKSGLEWSEELLYTFTDEYKKVTKKVVREMTKIFEHVYFGSAFDFASVESYSRQDNYVLVDIYVQFSGIVFNITTKDVKESFDELLEEEGCKKMMGKFEIDMKPTYFMVVDTSIPLDTMTAELYGVFLPDWALLVAVVGVISTFIITILGVIMGINKFRHNQVVKTKVLNPKTLQQFRGQRHFDMVNVDHVTAYATDKRDMWTLQKVQQEETKRSKSSLSKKFAYSDSGRGSGSEKYFSAQFSKVASFGKSGKGFYERFPSLGKGSSANHNDSNSELLEGYDNSGFNESGEILAKNVTDRDTSYENKKDDYEGRVDVGGNAVFKNTNDFDRECSNISRANLLQSLGDQGMTFEDSDSSLDAISDGPSERL